MGALWLIFIYGKIMTDLEKVKKESKHRCVILDNMWDSRIHFTWKIVFNKAKVKHFLKFYLLIWVPLLDEHSSKIFDSYCYLEPWFVTSKHSTFIIKNEFIPKQYILKTQYKWNWDKILNLEFPDFCLCVYYK